MLDAFATGLVLVFQWPAIGFLVLGVFLGLWLGAVPGIGGVTGLIVLLPFTLSMDAVPAFALLLGMFAVTATSDTVASVMLGVPGTASSQATILDGHPLARRGQAARAFGAAFTVSAFGGVAGALMLAVSLPVIRPVILAFGMAEFFMLTALGLAMVGSLSGRSIRKGLTVACIGLLISTVGYSEYDSVPRFWFGVDYFLNQMPLVAVVMGLFAIPELMDLAIRNRAISDVPLAQKGASMLDGIRDAWRNRWLSLRCSAIGIYVGMLPGLGSSVVDWVAYGHAVQSSKDKEKFGQGDIRGVIAPESANNAHRGGALIPTVAFGIPGDFAMAILLGALMIQGLRPGIEMLTTNLPITFSMVWTLIVANVLAAGALMIWSRQVARLAFVNGHLIVGGVIVFVFMGSWLGNQSLGDWILMFTLAVVGYVMKVSGWPRPPLVVALVLGPLMENSFIVANRIYGDFGWITRPLVLLFLVALVATIYAAARGIIKNRGNLPLDVKVGEGVIHNPALSVWLSAGFLLLFLAAGQEAVKLGGFPLLAVGIGLALVTLVLVSDVRTVRAELGEQSRSWRSYLAAGAEKALVRQSSRFLSLIALTIFAAVFVGQKVALPAFMAAYVVFWGKQPLWVGAVFATLGVVVTAGFYDRILHLHFMPALLFEWFGVGWFS